MGAPGVLTVIQTRTASSRLPGKVLMPLGGKAVFLRLVERVRRSDLAGRVVVATTDGTEDDPIETLCRLEGVDCFRGHPTDLLDRHYRAGLRYGADAVVKIPSDCPLVDPRVVDRVIGLYLGREGRYQYVSNLHPATYPDGNDVEVIAMEALEEAWREATRDFEREHTTPYIWERPHRFRVGNVAWESGRDCSMTHRWTLDYEEDYRLIAAVHDALAGSRPGFGVDDILDLLERRPEFAEINRRYLGVNWYRHHPGELATVDASRTRIPERKGGA